MLYVHMATWGSCRGVMSEGYFGGWGIMSGSLSGGYVGQHVRGLSRGLCRAIRGELCQELCQAALGSYVVFFFLLGNLGELCGDMRPLSILPNALRKRKTFIKHIESSRIGTRLCQNAEEVKRNSKIHIKTFKNLKKLESLFKMFVDFFGTRFDLLCVLAKSRPDPTGFKVFY